MFYFYLDHFIDLWAFSIPKPISHKTQTCQAHITVPFKTSYYCSREQKTMPPNRFMLLSIFLFCLSCFPSHARFITGRPSPTDLVSDGISTVKNPPYLLLKPLVSAEESCEQTYGFLPCTTTVLGNLFLIIVYGSLMFLAATYLSNGSELLLEILGPGIVGGLLLPILGAFPDAMLILGNFKALFFPCNILLCCLVDEKYVLMLCFFKRNLSLVIHRLIDQKTE